MFSASEIPPFGKCQYLLTQRNAHHLATTCFLPTVLAFPYRIAVTGQSSPFHQDISLHHRIINQTPAFCQLKNENFPRICKSRGGFSPEDPSGYLPSCFWKCYYKPKIVASRHGFMCIQPQTIGDFFSLYGSIGRSNLSDVPT